MVYIYRLFVDTKKFQNPADDNTPEIRSMVFAPSNPHIKPHNYKKLSRQAELYKILKVTLQIYGVSIRMRDPILGEECG